MTRCACGLPLHYGDETKQEYIESLVKEKGESVVIRTRRGLFRVQRHYLELHGVSEHELTDLFERGILIPEKEKGR